MEEEVTIKNAEKPSEEMKVLSTPYLTLKELKKKIENQLGRPEVARVGMFVMKDAEGQFVRMDESKMVGTRKVFLFRGVTLVPKREGEVDWTACNLDEFDGLDRFKRLQSPRSLKACQLEGIRPQDLFQTSIEDFWEEGISDRQWQLRYDICEAFREDSLAIARETYHLLKLQEEMQEQGAERSSPGSQRRGKLHGLHVLLPRASEKAGHGHHGHHGQTSFAEQSTVGLGGLWDGPMAPRAYPQVEKFCQAMRKSMETLFDGPSLVQGAQSKMLSSTSSLPDIRSSTFSMTSPGWMAEERRRQWQTMVRRANEEMKDGEETWKKWVEMDKHEREDFKTYKAERTAQTWAQDEQEVEMMVEKLLPMEGEQTSGLVLRTESVSVTQRRKNSMALTEGLEKVKGTVDRQVELAEAQRRLADQHHHEVRELSEHRRKTFKASSGEWKTSLQVVNSCAAEKRDRHWRSRREAVHTQQLESEAKRCEVIKEQTVAALARLKAAERTKDLMKVTCAREWLHRRMTWAQNSNSAATDFEFFKASILGKEEDAQARVDERNQRLLELIDFKRAYKVLRRHLSLLIREREEKRADFRRKFLADALTKLAESLPDTNESRGPPVPAANRKHFPKFDWGRFCVETTKHEKRATQPTMNAFLASSVFVSTM